MSTLLPPPTTQAGPSADADAVADAVAVDRTGLAKLPRSPREVRAFAATPSGKRFLKYSAVSGVSVVVSNIAFLIALQLTGDTWANVIAVSVGTVPSYELNRRWAWGRSGKGHLWREVAPFWIMSFIGLGFSTLCVYLVRNLVIGHDSETLGQTALIAFTNLAAFGVLWVGKFLVINRVLFRHTPSEQLDPVLDGRSGFPT